LSNSFTEPLKNVHLVNDAHKLDDITFAQTAIDKKLANLVGWGGGIGATVLFLLNYGERIVQ